MSTNTRPGAKKETLVEEGTTFKGSISSDCKIVVKGALEGEVSGPALHVADTGAVSGKVQVTELHSQGVLEGEFDAEIAQLSGQVKDKTVIRARQLDVKLSPAAGKMELVFGECEVEVGDVENKEEALARAAEAAVTKPDDSEAPAADASPDAADTDAAEDGGNSKTGKRRGKSETNSPPPN